MTRAVGYIRVSLAREEMISPELQRAAIERHCKTNKYRLVDVIEDLDATGRNFARAGVQHAIQQVENRQADVIVVWKYSRFGRTRRDWYVHLDKVELAGGRLESATEDTDTRTSVGRLTRGMLVELAAFESDRIGEVWREVHQRRLGLGLPATGGDRFGYQRLDGAYQPHPDTGPVLAQMYQWYVTGISPRTIAERLNDDGHRTSRGGAFTRDRVQRILDSGFGAGLLPVGVGYRARHVPGAHPPVIDQATWDAYRARRVGTHVPQRAHTTYPLSGLLTCGDCGAVMWSTRLGRENGYGYACSRWMEHRDVLCVTISRRRAEVEVLDWLETAWPEIAAKVKELEASAPKGASKATKALQRAEERLHRLTLGFADGTVPKDAYERARADIETQVAAATQALNTPRSPLPDVEEMLPVWQTLTVEEQRAVLGALIDRVVVHREKPRPRIEVIPHIGVKPR